VAGKFKIRFFVGAARADGQDVPLIDALERIKSKQAAHSMKRGSEVYFLRDLQSWNQGKNFKGVLAKMRTKNLPHKGDASGYEEELDLAPNQGLVEKSHFIYTHHRQMLIFQQNFHGGTASTLAEILGSALGATASFDPIVKADAMARLMSGGTEVRSIDLTVARPTNNEMFPSNSFAAGLLQVMSSTKAATFSVHLSANGPGSKGNSFPQKTKRAIKELVEGDHTTKAQVKIQSNGNIIPVDLLADSVISMQEVEMNDRYPITESMFIALEQARREVRGELDAFFGHDSNSLI
jgi:hypothetical protein